MTGMSEKTKEIFGNGLFRMTSRLAIYVDAMSLLAMALDANGSLS